MKRTTNFFASLFAAALVLTPLLGWGNGERTPGYVTVSGTYLFGIYSVRYNSAVTKGKVGYQLNPGGTLAVSGTDSSTGANFACTMARVENATKFDQMEKALLSITHGSWITATRVSTSDGHCNTLQIAGGSNFLE
jgi:hypothetical protein